MKRAISHDCPGRVNTPIILEARVENGSRGNNEENRDDLLLLYFERGKKNKKKKNQKV